MSVRAGGLRLILYLTRRSVPTQRAYPSFQLGNSKSYHIYISTLHTHTSSTPDQTYREPTIPHTHNPVYLHWTAKGRPMWTNPIDNDRHSFQYGPLTTQDTYSGQVKWRPLEETVTCLLSVWVSYTHTRTPNMSTRRSFAVKYNWSPHRTRVLKRSEKAA